MYCVYNIFIEFGCLWIALNLRLFGKSLLRISEPLNSLSAPQILTIWFNVLVVSHWMFPRYCQFGLLICVSAVVSTLQRCRPQSWVGLKNIHRQSVLVHSHQIFMEFQPSFPNFNSNLFDVLVIMSSFFCSFLSRQHFSVVVEFFSPFSGSCSSLLFLVLIIPRRIDYLTLLLSYNVWVPPCRILLVWCVCSELTSDHFQFTSCCPARVLGCIQSPRYLDLSVPFVVPFFTSTCPSSWCLYSVYSVFS